MKKIYCLLFIVLSSFLTYAQEIITVGGVVRSVSGEPLSGVAVFSVKDHGVYTDFDGAYSIKVAVGETLTFSLLGMKSQKTKINSKNDTTINVKLEESAKALEEMVVVGYRSEKRANLTTAIASISEESLENRPVANVAQALQGTVGNLNLAVGNEGGELGRQGNISIRGSYTVNDAPNPLVLIDGVEGSLALVNSADIQNVEVFKDGAAAAIYGSRAAAGVIFITTKKGKGKPKLNFSVNTSFNSPTFLPKNANALETATYFNDARKNGGQPILYSDAAIVAIKKNMAEPSNKNANNPGGYGPGNENIWAEYWYSYANTDWFKEYYKDYSPMTKYDVSLSGSKKGVRYYFSGGLLDQEGIFRVGNDTYKRYNFTTNINADITDWLDVAVSVKYNQSVRNSPYVYAGKGNYYHNIALLWVTSPLYDGNGHLYEEGYLMQKEGGRSIENQANINPSFQLNFKPLKDLTASIRYGINNYYNESANHKKAVYQYRVNGEKFRIGHSSPNAFTRNMSTNIYNTLNLFLNYDKTLADDHNIAFTGGMQTESFRIKSMRGSNTDVIDAVPSLSGASGKNPIVSDTDNHMATLGYFGRLNYNYKEQFFISASLRRDGSSRYAESKRWGVFPAVSAAVNFASLNFWKSNALLNNVSQFKLRGSFSDIGNQQVGSSFYLYSPTLGVSRANYILGGVRPQVFTAPGLVSPSLTWETYRNVGVGLDSRLLQDRLVISVDWYQRTTIDMIAPSDLLPNALGTGAPNVNRGSLRNTGVELTVSWSDVIGKDFSYNLRGIFADQYSTVTDYPNEKKLLANGTHYSGKELGEIWGYTTDKVLQTAGDLVGVADHKQISAVAPGIGDIAYKDLNGDGKITNGKNTTEDPGDRSVIGNSTPRYTYSLYGEASWKGFDFKMLWQGVGKRDLALGGVLFWGVTHGPSQWGNGSYKHVLDYWTPENTDAYFAKPYMGQGANNQQVQTRFLQNGAYLRLKQIQVGYTIPSFLSKKVRIENVRLYVSAENILTISSLFDRGFDPEAVNGNWGNGKVYPMGKNISVGLNMQF